MKNLLEKLKIMEPKVMTEKQKKIEKGLHDLQEWMLPLRDQFKKTGDLDNTKSKLLFAVRDLAFGIKPVTVPAPPPPPTEKFYMEMSARELFERLDGKRDLMTPEHRHSYDQLRRMFEEDGHSGVSLPWDTMDFLRRLYGTMFFSRK